jgi:hypothetical protein
LPTPTHYVSRAFSDSTTGGGGAASSYFHRANLHHRLPVELENTTMPQEEEEEERGEEAGISITCTCSCNELYDEVKWWNVCVGSPHKLSVKYHHYQSVPKVSKFIGIIGHPHSEKCICTDICIRICEYWLLHVHRSPTKKSGSRTKIHTKVARSFISGECWLLKGPSKHGPLMVLYRPLCMYQIYTV